MVFSKVGPNQSIEWGQIRVSKSARSLDSGEEGNRDKAIFRMVSKSSGRNESERRCGLESEKPQGLSLQPEGESSMDRRRLTDAAVFTLAG